MKPSLPAIEWVDTKGWKLPLQIRIDLLSESEEIQEIRLPPRSFKFSLTSESKQFAAFAITLGPDVLLESEEMQIEERVLGP